MSWTRDARLRRRHSAAADDQRDRFERDRDRILYSSAFQRLAGITQVVRAGEADVFHTRYQHTIKVAQVGRRLAQICVRQQSEICEELGVDPEVVEAACLAHDLGHPPFGHVGEYLLNKLVAEQGDEDGFEGNAQTFRIVTKLAVRFVECRGLDLMRATLAACLKYPWFRDANDSGRAKKWGAYRLETEDFNFCRDGLTLARKTAEAELMDWADDVAYSVHDLEDFHRCGALPWYRILGGEASERIVQRAVSDWYGAPPDAAGRLREAMRSLEKFLQGGFARLISEPYERTREQRQQLRTMTSKLIGRYIRAARLRVPPATDPTASCLEVQQDEGDEVRILKQITRDYIINTPSLAAQQRGQEVMLRHLFRELHDDAKNGLPRYLPSRLRYLYEPEVVSNATFAADCIASLTEGEAVALYRRIQGSSSGSVLDPIVR